MSGYARSIFWTGPGTSLWSGSPDVALLVKSYWEAIGIEVTIEQLPHHDAFSARITPSGGIGAQDYEAQMFWTNHPCCPVAVLRWLKTCSTRGSRAAPDAMAVSFDGSAST